jgi:transposase
MRVVHPVCAGMDVHKEDVKVCLVWRDDAGERCEEVRTFSTMTRPLLLMREWLGSYGCKVVVMESTGNYWKPVFNLLDGVFEVMLVNPGHLKYVEGFKTDAKDARWLAGLLEYGLLRGSFIPPSEIRDLRDMTRYRRRLIEERSAEVNRVQKILEEANIKLASVVSDVMGVSGRAILSALLEGEMTPEQMAELSRGRLRHKRGELAESLEGRFRPHHALLLSRMLEHIDFLDGAIEDCDTVIEDMLRPFVSTIENMDTVPGIDVRAAQDIIAEIGLDMSVFPTDKHLCSWAAVCPGNHESGGKRKSGKTRNGNKWLRATLVQCAHAAGHSRKTYLGTQYGRFAARKGKQKAAIAVGHSILEAIYFIIRDHVPYQELGPEYFDKINKDHIIRNYKKRLEALGLIVEVSEAQVAA